MTSREQKLFSVLSGKVPNEKRFAPVQTEWIAVTGTPGSGKTSTCEWLAARGCEIVPEASREALNDAAAAGFPPDEVHAHPDLLARAVILRKLMLVQSIAASRRCVWDTAVVDAVVFARRAGVETVIAAETAKMVRFRAAAILAPLPHSCVSNDPVRPQTDAVRESIDRELNRAYVEFGYVTFPVEVAPLGVRGEALEAWIRTMWR